VGVVHVSPSADAALAGSCAPAKRRLLSPEGEASSLVQGRRRRRGCKDRLDANVLFTAAHNSKGKAAFVVEISKGQGHWET
jgi:hypothetical protein